MSTAPEWLQRFVRDCQVIAGHAVDAPGAGLVGLVRDALERVPVRLSPVDTSVVCHVAIKTITRLIHSSRVENDTSLVDAAARSVYANGINDGWREHLATLVEACTTYTASTADDCSHAPVSPTVVEALDEILRRYADPRLCLNAIAKSLRRSPAHLTSTTLLEQPFRSGNSASSTF